MYRARYYDPGTGRFLSLDPKIFSGARIKRFYLKKKLGKFSSLCVPYELRKLPSWLEDSGILIDTERQLLQVFDKPLEKIIKPVGYRAPTENLLIVDSILS